MTDGRMRVVLLPGVVMPPDLAYGPLIEELGDEVDAVAKGLELYEGDGPPPGYSVETEIEGVLRAAEKAGAVVHTGPETLRFGPDLWALPVSALWTPR